MNAERDNRKLVNANPDAEVPGQQQPAGESDLDHRRETESERQRRIAIGAYYNAEHRGFEEGEELNDWLQAEQEDEKSTGRDRAGETIPETAADQGSEANNKQFIEPGEIRQWAPRLNVSATRLREAIKNAGSRLSDIKRYLSKPDQPDAQSSSEKAHGTD